ncbi:MAG TPA: sigma-54 dependent transcriptional regulator, partial [Anaeromyxobacteraceae bacterium]|nr:sigma-54 dependent transcriptional regulator [Anaeromyxobacteraceae bacterium]
MSVRILVVDDEPAFLESVLRMLRLERYDDVTAVSRGAEALARLETERFDVAFLDVCMPEMDGLELLRLLKERSPATECVMVTASESIPTVIRAVRLGAYDYLVKPILPEQLVQALDRVLERRRLVETVRLRSASAVDAALDHPEAFGELVTADAALLRLLHEAELHAACDIPVLITGETGAGKEVLARAVHRCSPRAAGPFVAVNMLALSPTLFESEFFGHARGAFTGADRDRAGYLAQARGGTLFLDEIGDLPLEVQGKLLRVLQEREYTPVGRTRPERADVRFVAATNQDLEARVRAGAFRKDLFYRLQFAHLHLPPLRERAGDVALLADHVLRQLQRPGITLDDDALRLLERHDWPGNVRELRGVLE